jgi:hypothetical protein
VKFLSIGVLCIGFIAVNFLFRKALTSVKSKAGILGIINRYFPIIELAFWVVFVIWASGILLAGSQFFFYVIFLMITLGFVLFFLFFIRDYIAGIQLKSRYNLSTSQLFKSGQINGIIKKLGLLSVEVKSENGSDFKIPYAQIDQKSIELNIQEKSGGETLIKVALDQKLDDTDAIQKITELVINSPWSSHKSNPIVHIKESEKGQKIFDISCVTNGERGTKKLKELIEREFGGRKKQPPRS